MAKRFFYVSLGILCLVAAYQLGVERAQADWDPNSPGAVLGGDHGTYFGTAGDAWTIDSPTGSGKRLAEYDLPIAASEVRFFSQSAWGGGIAYLVTLNDEAWVKHGNGYPWRSVGPFPGGPVALNDASWGEVKGAYR